MATQTSTRTLTYGRHSSLQTITVTPLEQHKDGYWVMYDLPSHPRIAINPSDQDKTIANNKTGTPATSTVVPGVIQQLPQNQLNPPNPFSKPQTSPLKASPRSSTGSAHTRTTLKTKQQRLRNNTAMPNTQIISAMWKQRWISCRIHTASASGTSLSVTVVARH
jgi:hypothetical protein